MIKGEQGTKTPHREFAREDMTLPLLETKPKHIVGFSATVAKLLAPPTTTELQGCWELCRLHNNIGFWVVWLPTGKIRV